MFKYLIMIILAIGAFNEAKDFALENLGSIYAVIFVCVISTTLIALLVAYKIIRLKRNGATKPPKKPDAPIKDPKTSAYGTIKRD